MAAPEIYGNSVPGVHLELQPRPKPPPWQHQIWAASVTYVAAWGNAGSLTHWARPGLNQSPHGDYIQSLTHWATVGTLTIPFLILPSNVRDPVSQHPSQHLDLSIFCFFFIWVSHWDSPHEEAEPPLTRGFDLCVCSLVRALCIICPFSNWITFFKLNCVWAVLCIF